MFICFHLRKHPRKGWRFSPPPLPWIGLSRLPGLGSDLTTFNFKLLHRLLVTRERMHQMNPAVSSSCLQCNNGTEDLAHALIHCSYNQEVGLKLLNYIQNLVPAMKDQGLLHLEITGLSSNMEFPAVFLTSSILMYIWNQRMSKVRISLFDIRTSLEAKCILLRKTRFENHATGLETLLNSM